VTIEKSTSAPFRANECTVTRAADAKLDFTSTAKEIGNHRFVYLFVYLLRSCTHVCTHVWECNREMRKQLIGVVDIYGVLDLSSLLLIVASTAEFPS